MEYCCHERTVTPRYYLGMLDRLQKWVCRAVGPSLAASLEPLAHRQNVASVSPLYRHYSGKCSSEPAEVVSLARPLIILMVCMTFLSPFLDVMRMSRIFCVQNVFL